MWLQSQVKEFQGANDLESWEVEKMLEETPTPLKRFEGMGPLQAFVNDAALFSPDDMAAERESNAVRLSTIHAAKGLEFPVVFLIGGIHFTMCLHGQMQSCSLLSCMARTSILLAVVLIARKSGLVKSYLNSKLLLPQAQVRQMAIIVLYACQALQCKR